MKWNQACLVKTKSSTRFPQTVEGNHIPSLSGNDCQTCAQIKTHQQYNLVHIKWQQHNRLLQVKGQRDLVYLHLMAGTLVESNAILRIKTNSGNVKDCKTAKLTAGIRILLDLITNQIKLFHCLLKTIMEMDSVKVLWSHIAYPLSTFNGLQTKFCKQWEWLMESYFMNVT